MLGDTTDTTIEIYAAQPNDLRQPVAPETTNDEATDLCIAITIRQLTPSLRPVHPYRSPDTQDDDVPNVRVYFDLLKERSLSPAVQRVDSLTATLTWLDEDGEPDPSREPILLSPTLYLGGSDEWEMLALYTENINLEQEELSDLLFDAYRDSVQDDNYNEWDDLKYELLAFRERMEDVAAAILEDPQKAFRNRLSSYLTRFDPGPLRWPDQEFSISVQDGRTIINFTVRPQQAAQEDRPNNPHSQLQQRYCICVCCCASQCDPVCPWCNHQRHSCCCGPCPTEPCNPECRHLNCNHREAQEAEQAMLNVLRKLWDQGTALEKTLLQFRPEPSQMDHRFIIVERNGNRRRVTGRELAEMQQARTAEEQE